MAAAGDLTPLGTRPVNQVGKVGESAHDRNWEPVALGNANAGLVLDVVGQVRQRVALSGATVFCDFLVTTGEGDWLEAEERDLLGVVEGKLNDATDLLVVDAVDDRGDRYDVDTVGPAIFDCAHFYIE